MVKSYEVERVDLGAKKFLELRIGWRVVVMVKVGVFGFWDESKIDGEICELLGDEAEPSLQLGEEDETVGVGGWIFILVNLINLIDILLDHMASYEWVYDAYLLPRQFLTEVLMKWLTNVLNWYENKHYVCDWNKKHLMYWTIKVSKFYCSKVKITLTYNE